MFKFIFLALALSSLSSVAGACFATMRNAVDGPGAPVSAAGPAAAGELAIAQPVDGTTESVAGAAPHSAPIAASTARTGAAGGAASYVRELLEALEREQEGRIEAERRLAREQVRHARSEAAAAQPAPVVIQAPAPPPAAPQARAAVVERIVESAPAAAVVVPPARTAEAAERRQASGTIAAGTTIRASVDRTVRSDRAQPGDEVRASVRSTVADNGRVVLADGDQLIGTVTTADQSGRMSGSQTLTVDFHAVLIDGRRFELESGSVTRTGPGQGQQNAIRIGGGATAGAVIGAIFGGKRGAALGGAIGAAGGTAAAAAQRGGPATLEAGETIVLRTTRGTSVPAR